MNPCQPHRLLAACVLWIGLAGCSSTPTPRFHSLLSAQPMANAAQPSPAFVVELGPVGIPPSLDQPQWVLRLGDDSLRVLEQERWVAPLRDELHAALLQRLSARWGGVDARMALATTLPGWRVRVDVQRLESLAGREVWLAASWSLAPLPSRAPNPTSATPLACATTVHEPATGDVLMLAAAHRRTVARLADQIGERLHALSQGGTAQCLAGPS